MRERTQRRVVRSVCRDSCAALAAARWPWRAAARKTRRGRGERKAVYPVTCGNERCTSIDVTSCAHHDTSSSVCRRSHTHDPPSRMCARAVSRLAYPSPATRARCLPSINTRVRTVHSTTATRVSFRLSRTGLLPFAVYPPLPHRAHTVAVTPTARTLT